MIKPTVGRVVWFYPAKTEGMARGAARQPLAAVVAHVWSDVLVNLAVFDASGGIHSRTNVPLYQGDGERPADFFCEWMPYQKGQAAKTEALEKAAAK